MDTVIMGIGPGWYAPRQERGALWYYWCGENLTQEPDTYPMRLGAPVWCDVPPAWAELKFGMRASA